MKMPLAVLVLAPATVVPVLFLARRLRKMSRRTQDALAEMSAMATEALGSSRTSRALMPSAPRARSMPKSPASAAARR